eukprot:TRINITY_DN2599_c0_g1_i1.p1 TRINITY_DN2599_c0_g1~~TRINITY_DN2599_c0_g1_i1.p1  ORF type:complete len:281 (+),score=89.86 TRINITY_DN2599_c0_g1_i1:44-886(+)
MAQSNATVPIDHCTILGDDFDFLVQGGLALICVGVLVLKWRFLEREARPTWLWLADNGKQLVGFGIAHIGNLLMSELLMGDDSSSCVWYFVNILLDCTVRVLWAYGLLRLAMREARRQELTSLYFGEYGDLKTDGRRSVLNRWFKQTVLWALIVLLTRSLLGLVTYLLQSPLKDFGNFLLGWFEDYTAEHGHKLELVFVMVIFPLLLLAFQLWVQDAFLQSDAKYSEERALLRYCPCCSVCVTERKEDIGHGVARDGELGRALSQPLMDGVEDDDLQRVS